MRRFISCLASLLLLASLRSVAIADDDPKKGAPDSKVTPIPEDIIKKYKLDTDFYKKHLDYNGFSILSSTKVSDDALYEARYLIHQLLGDRQDILKAMIKSGCRFMVMAPTEMTTDVPEQRHLKKDPKTNWDTRARSTRCCVAFLQAVMSRPWRRKAGNSGPPPPCDAWTSRLQPGRSLSPRTSWSIPR